MSAAQSIPHPWHSELPTLGSDAEFAALRRTFRENGYNAENLCRHLNVGVLDLYKTPSRELREAVPVQHPLDALIRLFIDAVYLNESALQTLPEDAVAAMWSMNLLARDATHPGECYANFTIPPVRGVLTLMDRAISPDGSTCPLPGDVVYPAVVDNTREFLEGLPQNPCDALLDIGTGTGIAAAEGARYARHSWGTDIIARPVRFAEFTRRFNGIDNMTVLQGDLYQPLKGLTFDRIVTHPPYVPARRNAVVFRDGGEDGEQIIRGVIAGLPEFLRPGGSLYSIHMASDRTGEPYEHRIRKWLGDRQNEFDVMVAVLRNHHPNDFVTRQLEVLKRPESDAAFWRAMWAENKTEFLVYSWILVRRHTAVQHSVTVRANAGKKFQPSHMDRLLQWEALAASPGGTAMLLASKPALAPNCELVVLNRVRDGQFSAEQFQIRTHEPFDNTVQIDGWVAELLAECDGVLSGQDHFERRVKAGVLPPNADPAEFANVLRWLISSGAARVPQYSVE
jgi:carbamoyltransferase